MHRQGPSGHGANKKPRHGRGSEMDESDQRVNKSSRYLANGQYSSSTISSSLSMW